MKSKFKRDNQKKHEVRAQVLAAKIHQSERNIVLEIFKKSITGLILLTGLCLFVPWSPRQDTFYYEYAIHLVAEKGWQFGVDILAIYGPLGFIGLPFYRESTYLIMIAANICICGLMMYLLWDFWRRLIGWGRPSALWIVLLIILPGFGPGHEWGAILFVPHILANILVVDYFLAGNSRGEVRLVLPVCMLAFFVLVKGPFIVLSIISVGVVALDQLLVQRRVPWVVPIFGATLLVLWVVSGQKITNIDDYFVNSMDLISGYKDALGITDRNPNGSAGILVYFVSVCLCILGVFSWVGWKSIRWRVIWPAGMFGVTLLMVFQHGFVRGDVPHVSPACLTLFCLCLLVVPVLWRLSGGCHILHGALVFNALSVIIFLFSCLLSGVCRIEWSRVQERAAGAWMLLNQGVAPLNSAAASNLKRLKATTQLPRLEQTLDCSAVNFGLADAYGVQTLIKPTMTSYQANTFKSSLRNMAYLEDVSGPNMILFPANISIDGRYPTIADPFGLLAIKSHFEAIGSTAGIMLLKRRIHPQGVDFVRLEERVIGFNEVVKIPDIGDDIVFAKIFIQPTLCGRLIDAAYKIPETYISIAVGAQSAKFRLITATAKEGFILSPLLYDLLTFQSFYSSSGVGPKVNVSSFRIECEAGKSWCFESQIKLEFFRVTIKKNSSQNASGSLRAKWGGWKE